MSRNDKPDNIIEAFFYIAKRCLTINECDELAQKLSDPRLVRNQPATFASPVPRGRGRGRGNADFEASPRAPRGGFQNRGGFHNQGSPQGSPQGQPAGGRNRGAGGRGRNDDRPVSAPVVAQQQQQQQQQGNNGGNKRRNQRRPQDDQPVSPIPAPASAGGRGRGRGGNRGGSPQ
jgi:hypothetical protein